MAWDSTKAAEDLIASAEWNAMVTDQKARAAGTHAHGEITSDGVITTNVTVATGDRILISDSSDSSKIKGGTAFGTTTTTYLNNAGAFTTPPDTNTTYSEISEADLLAGTATTEGSITGRRAGYLKSLGVGFVNHGATAGTARPANFGLVIWIGSVEPTNATNDDIWVDTT